MMADHFCSAMPDPCRSRDRSIGDHERALGIASIPSGKGHHRSVRDFDAAETVPLAQLDALTEPVVRADHPSADIFGVAEAAEGHRLQLCRTGAPRQLQRDAVFLQTAFDVAARKT